MRIIALLVLLAAIALAIVQSARDDDDGLPAPPSTLEAVPHSDYSSGTNAGNHNAALTIDATRSARP